MKQYELGEMEQRFADLMWAHCPLPSGQLVQLCEQHLNWKKSTTYTMLRRLCQRNIFENRDGVVHVLLDKDTFHSLQGEAMIQENFGGSLPQFLVAFTRRNKLSTEEVTALQQLIDQHKED